MRRRIKKKKVNKYNVLREAKRQKQKQKGVRCISYEFLPIGKQDRRALDMDELIPDYSFATHWLIEAYAWNDSSQVRIFPCTENGGTTNISPLQIVLSDGNNVKDVKKDFKLVVEAIRNDHFWEPYYPKT